MSDFLATWYPWTKALHVISMVAWMAGMFYLPRLYVYHAEVVERGSETDRLFQTMERRLLRAIINPAMIATFLFGAALLATPGIVTWSMGWIWVKLAMVVVMGWLHGWLSARRKDFVRGENRVSGRTYRMMNEVPTVAMIVIVIMVIVKPF